MLVSFLERYSSCLPTNSSSLDAAKALIDKIKDPVAREEILNLPQYKQSPSAP